MTAAAGEMRFTDIEHASPILATKSTNDGSVDLERKALKEFLLNYLKP
jgi:hypothetical protein